MAHVSDCTITKVYEGKSGEGEYGPWTAWNFYVDKSDNKFSYFSGGKKPKPEEGMKLELLRFETVINGEYTNHNVKEMFIDASTPNTPQKPTQKPSASTGGTISLEGLSFYVSYAKDLMCKAMELNADYGQRAVDALAAEVMEIGKDMCRSAMEIPDNKPNPNPINVPEPPHDEFSDGTPLPEEPPF